MKSKIEIVKDLIRSFLQRVKSIDLSGNVTERYALSSTQREQLVSRIIELLSSDVTEESALIIENLINESSIKTIIIDNQRHVVQVNVLSDEQINALSTVLHNFNLSKVEAFETAVSKSGTIVSYLTTDINEEKAALIEQIIGKFSVIVTIDGTDYSTSYDVMSTAQAAMLNNALNAFKSA